MNLKKEDVLRSMRRYLCGFACVFYSIAFGCLSFFFALIYELFCRIWDRFNKLNPDAPNEIVILKNILILGALSYFLSQLWRNIQI